MPNRQYITETVDEAGHHFVIPDKRVDRFTWITWGFFMGGSFFAGGILSGQILLLLWGIGGLFAIYFGLTMLLGEYTITLGRTHLRRRFGPLPWYPQKPLDQELTHVRQLRIGRTLARKKQKAYYSLYLILEDETELRLLDKQTDFPALRELEVALETALDLPADDRIDLSKQGLTRSELIQRVAWREGAHRRINGIRFLPETWKSRAYDRMVEARKELREFQERTSGR